MLSITDTHRLRYCNATLYAYDYSNQTLRIPFYDADGNSLGTTLYTNDKGYLVYGSASSIASGYYVDTQALIVCTLPSGETVQWVTLEKSDTVNDGTLVGLNDEVVFTANQSGTTSFDYNKLLNKPVFKAWSERQQNVAVAEWGQVVTVSKDTTVLKIIDQGDCIKGGVCSYRKQIVLNPPKRAGQQLMVVTDCPSDCAIFNTNVSLPAYTDDNQYTGAVAVIGSYEGVVLCSVYTEDDVWIWQAVSQTSLFSSATATTSNGLQYVTVTDGSTIIDADVNSETEVLIFSTNASSDTALTLQFERAGQNVLVINNSLNRLLLCNTEVTSVDDSNAVVIIPASGSSASVKAKESAVIGSGMISNSVLRFWGIAGFSDTSYGFKRQLVRFSPTQTISTETAIVSLGTITIDVDATALSIVIDLSNITATVSTTLSFSAYVVGGVSGQSVVVLPPVLTGTPQLADGVTAKYNRLYLGAHISIRTLVTDATTSKWVSTTWTNTDDNDYITSLPLDSWRVIDCNNQTRCSELITARCSAYRRVSTSGSYTIETDMHFTTETASGTTDDNSTLWNNPTTEWVS